MTTPRQEPKIISHITTRKNGTKRIQFSTPEESITDQESARELSMASIKRKLENNLPINNLTNNAFHSLEPLKYTNLQDALNFHQEVTSQFEQLPSEIRKAMGNNIHNLEPYLQDPANAETLLKYGLLSKPDATNQNIVDNLKDLKNHLTSAQSPDPELKTPKKPKE